MKKMPVVILCGGQGTRLREETEVRPKPMVEVGGKPILWHIMMNYSAHGFNDFILCLGYKGHVIKEYFLNYEIMQNNFQVSLGRRNHVKILGKRSVTPWTVTLVNTGENAMTGSRVKQIEPYVKANEFMLSYGDGVGSINITKLVAFHHKHGKIGTVTGVRPPSRFGEMVVKNGNVLEFSEKPQIKEGHINGGFFVFKKEFFRYLPANDKDLVLEKDPLESLARDRQLMVNYHDGFWQCMDTYRDFKLLNELWDKGNPPWVVKNGQ